MIIDGWNTELPIPYEGLVKAKGNSCVTPHQVLRMCTAIISRIIAGATTNKISGDISCSKQLGSAVQIKNKKKHFLSKQIFKHFCQTPGLGLELGVDFTFTL